MDFNSTVTDGAPPEVEQTNGSGHPPRGHDPVSGRFQPGNGAALVHGLSRPERLDQIAVRELRDAALVGLGGEECSAVLQAQVDDFAQAVVLRDAAYAYLASVGPLTKAGRTRSVVGIYLQASARAERLASQIGLERKARPVPSLSEILAAEREP